MTLNQYNLVVVGGGPAGSNAARVLKESRPDFDVALFERGENPTSNCAGGLGLPFVKHMGFEPPEKVIESPIREVSMSSPNEEVSISMDDVDVSSVDWYDGEVTEMGWVVDRSAWDNHQLDMASDAGVEVERKHVVKGIEQNESGVTVTVLNRDENEKFDVTADYVALATGANWSLAIEAGFDENTVVPPKTEQHMGCQFHMKDPDFMEEYGWDNVYLRFDRDYAPEGYTWSFPEGKEYTRWGNGIPLSREENASEKLNEWLEDNDRGQYIETSREKTMALIPTANPLKTCINGRVALVGDTGHHCDPLHGGGMMFGSRAGKWLGKSIARGKFHKYDDYWKDDFLDTLQHRFIIRDLLYNMDNDEYDRFIASIKDFKINSLNPDKEIPRMMWHCLRQDSGIFTKTAKEATTSLIRQKIGF